MIIVTNGSRSSEKHDPWCYIGCEHDEAAQTRMNEIAAAEREITTITNIEDLPNPSGPSYPLVPVDRSKLTTWALFVLWVRLIRWRWKTRRVTGERQS